VLAGLALGLAAGSRPANLAAVVLFVVAVVAGTILAGRQGGDGLGRTLADAGRNVAVVTVPALLIGGYWYLRNWVEHANPFAPYSFGPFSGDGTVDALLVSPNRPESLDGLGRVAQTLTSWASDLSPDVYGVDQRLGGLGPVFLLALLPGLLVFLSRSWRSNRTAALAVVAPAAVILAVQPAPWWSRGTLFVPGIAAAGLAAVLPRDPGTTRRLVLGGLGVLLCWGLWVTTATSIYSDVATHERLSVGQTWDLLGDGDRAHAVLPYNGYVVLDRYPSGTRVALLEGQVPSHRSPLYGRDLQRDLVILPATDDPAELAAAMEVAGADLAVISISKEPLVAAIRATGDPLRIVGERGTSPARTVLVERV